MSSTARRETAAGGVVVLGSGFVGAAIAARLGGRLGGRLGYRVAEGGAGRPVSVLSRSTHGHLARPGPQARDLIQREIDRIGAVAVVNCVGLQRGTADELAEANVAWPAWLAGNVVPGTGCRLVHLGSAAEYGDPGSARPVPETADPRPQGPYGETKWAGSAQVLDARRAGLDAMVVRGFNLVGPQPPPWSPLHQFVADVSALGPEGGPVEVWWPATVRDFVLVDDLAAAVAQLATAPTVPDIVNICSGVGLSFAEVVTALAERHGTPVEIVSLDRPGIPAVVGDNRRLRDVCGLTPAMSPAILAANAGIGRVP